MWIDSLLSYVLVIATSNSVNWRSSLAHCILYLLNCTCIISYLTFFKTICVVHFSLCGLRGCNLLNDITILTWVFVLLILCLIISKLFFVPDWFGGCSIIYMLFLKKLLRCQLWILGGFLWQFSSWLLGSLSLFVAGCPKWTWRLYMDDSNYGQMSGLSSTCYPPAHGITS